MVNVIFKGGFFIWPLFVCSVLTLFVTMERFYYFYHSRTDVAGLLTRIKELLGKGNLHEAHMFARSKPGPVAHVVGKGLELAQSTYTPAEKEKIIAQAGSNALRKLEKHLRTLGIIAHVAPLLGLLGTVTGMIGAFMKIQELGGQVDASVLAGGIWEALLTTAAGLSVAIPTMIIYHYFEGRVDDFYAQMKNAVQELSGFLGLHQGTQQAFDGHLKEDIEYGV